MMQLNQGGPVKEGLFQAGPFTLQFRDTEGSGPVCLVVGSALYYSRSFHPQMNQNFRMIYMDHRGFSNPSGSVTEADYSLATLMSDIERFRAEMKLGPIAILGHSAHGYMALEYAKRYPGSVSHVCLVATGPSHGSHMQEAERNWTESVCTARKDQFEMDCQNMERQIANSPEDRFVLFCKGMRTRAWNDWNFDIDELWKGVQTYMPAIDHLFGEVFRDIKIEEGLPDLKVPVLLMLGRLDYQVAPSWTWNQYRPLFQKLTVRIFEKSAHNPQTEQALEFYHEFKNWIDQTAKENS
ncbi:alpha/beta hydrolase [Bdellovibrio sp. ArHS]|uniref:alpha/beta fold hydrolase n=1 Tax=Bdellovibrio sp. ArHS TaxID=1569284 RepID=UPI0025BDBA49|nr:alpha/beta hydrolase [Bdellovibrio sp. ArHS]